MIIACDFDGTLCEHKYPEIGEPNLLLIKSLIKKRQQGDQVILWTCRAGDDLQRAVDWCFLQHGLTFDAINRDVDDIVHSNFGINKSGKVYADVYLDDRNLDINTFLLGVLHEENLQS